MHTLGINAAFHDSAACLVQDGQVVAAAEVERFTRIKHGKRPVPFSTWELPFHAIDFCLREAGIRLVDVDHVAYSYDPYLLLGGHRGDATITLPLEPSAHPRPEEWEAAWDPLFLSSIVNAPRQLAGGAPPHLRERLAGPRPGGPSPRPFPPPPPAPRGQPLSRPAVQTSRDHDARRPGREGHHSLCDRPWQRD